MHSGKRSHSAGVFALHSCPGTSFLENGGLLVTGGAMTAATSLYRANAWTSKKRMHVKRGYQTQITLTDGNVFALGGSWSGFKNEDKYGEVYSVKKNVWYRKPGIPGWKFATAERETDAEYHEFYRSDNHYWLFQASGYKSPMQSVIALHGANECFSFLFFSNCRHQMVESSMPDLPRKCTGLIWRDREASRRFQNL